MSSDTKAASDVLKAFCNSNYDSSQHTWKCPRDHAAEAAALSAAGLLRTEADRMAEALHGPLADTRYDGDGPWLFSSNGRSTVHFKTNDAAQRFHSALSALALHVRPKPVERWTLEPHAYSGGWAAKHIGGSVVVFPPDAEPEARAYVARKNAAERAK